ncbi:hypothetical protein [Candidatus Vallotiella sp. (ex Adelges kitamiensis)]|nr:hypothetical protein [Candidatus Vallotia sp. (ex Adelges kitamiensis)]
MRLHLQLGAFHSFAVQLYKETFDENRAIRVERGREYDVATPQQTT